MTDMRQAPSQGIPSDHFDRTQSGVPAVERIVSDSGELHHLESISSTNDSSLDASATSKEIKHESRS